MKRYFDRIDRNWYEEKQLRIELINCEVGDLINNLEDFKNGELDVDYQTNCIRRGVMGAIEEVVETLNLYWNYELVPEDKYYMEEYTFLSSKVGDLEKQLEETKSKIKDVQSNINRLEEENK